MNQSKLSWTKIFCWIVGVCDEAVSGVARAALGGRSRRRTAALARSARRGGVCSAIRGRRCRCRAWLIYASMKQSCRGSSGCCCSSCSSSMWCSGAWCWCTSRASRSRPSGPSNSTRPASCKVCVSLQPPTPKVTSTRDARFLPLLSRSPDHVFDFAGAAPRVWVFFQIICN